MLNDKAAIITGPIRGLDFQVSKEFTEGGASVTVCSRSIASGEKSASPLNGKAYLQRLDFINALGIEEFVPHIAERDRQLEILVSNAGYPFDSMIWHERFHEVDEEGLERAIEVNLNRGLRLSQAAIRFMIKMPQQRHCKRGLSSDN